MIKQRIEEYIDNNVDNIIETTKQLVRVPSVNGKEKPGMPFGEGPDQALNLFLEISKDMGFKVTNYDGYVGALDMSDKEKGLDILGHLDVVPANAAEWTVCKPYEPVVKDGKIFGRGTADDKGPVVAALFAMKAVKDLDIPLSKNVRLIVGTDEELGGSDIDYYYKTNKVAPATFSPDADFPVINVEKGRLNASIDASFTEDTPEPKVIMIKAGSAANVIPDAATAVIKGISQDDIDKVKDDWKKATGQSLMIETGDDQVSVTAIGVGGHAAYPHNANNALTALLDLIARLPLADSQSFRKIKGLSQLFPHGDWAGEGAGVKMSDEVSEHLTISLNIMNLDDKGFSAQYDSRTPVMATKENTIDVIDAKTKEHGLTQNVISTNEPHYVPEDTPFIQTLLSAYEEYTGNKGECLVTGGGTYVHGLENAVAFGASMPDTENNMHGADEFAVIDELIVAAKIFAQVIVDMCS